MVLLLKEFSLNSKENRMTKTVMFSLIVTLFSFPAFAGEKYERSCLFGNKACLTRYVGTATEEDAILYVEQAKQLVLDLANRPDVDKAFYTPKGGQLLIVTAEDHLFSRGDLREAVDIFLDAHIHIKVAGVAYPGGRSLRYVRFVKVGNVAGHGRYQKLRDVEFMKDDVSN